MSVNTQWQPWFLEIQCSGDMRFQYVPFHKLSLEDQAKARAAYPYKTCGGKYNFIDEHYLYPVKKNGRLAKASRSLANTQFKICDDNAMAEHC